MRCSFAIIAGLCAASALGAAEGAKATLTMLAQDCTARAYLNGRELPADRANALDLQDGLNLIGIVAKSTGDTPGLKPSIVLDEHTLAADSKWLVRAERPPDDWLSNPSAEGWSPASVTERGLWAADKAAREVWLRRGVFVSESGPRFFPKMPEVFIPRRSAQLVKPYLRLPPALSSEGYRLILEVPAALTLEAADGMAGARPDAIEEEKAASVGDRSYRRYSIAYDMFPGTGLELSLRWADADNATISYAPAIAAGGTFGWRRFTTTVTPPNGAVSVHPLIIKWQKRGISGTFWVDNLVVREKGSQENLLKMGSFDEPEWGSQWQLAKGEGPDGSACVKFVCKPDDADRQQALWVDPDDAVIPVQQEKDYVIELDARANDLGSPNQRPKAALLIRAGADLPDDAGPIYAYWEAERGSVTELPQATDLAVLPPLKNVRPKRARITPCYYSSMFSDPKVQAALADNTWRSGMTWIYGRAANEVARRLRPKGLKVILSIPWRPWSSLPATRELIESREDIQALKFDGKRDKNTFCPTWALTEGDVVMDALEQRLLSLLKEGQYAGADWDFEQPIVDPPTFCVCERCLRAFREAAGIPDDVALDGAVILEKYRSEWTAFRCKQNAEMARRMSEMVAKAGGDVEFSMYSGYQGQRTQEHYGVDWSLLAPALQLGIAGYGGARDAIYATRGALGDVPFMGGEMYYLSPHEDTRPAPNPRAWRNRLLRQFVESGGVGCLIWYLPTMDGGAFYHTSEAAEIIARHERFFTRNERCDDEVTVSGLPPTDFAMLKQGKRRLLLLMNFKDEDVAVRVQAGEALRGRTATADWAGLEITPDDVGLSLLLPPYGTEIVLFARPD